LDWHRKSSCSLRTHCMKPECRPDNKIVDDRLWPCFAAAQQSGRIWSEADISTDWQRARVPQIRPPLRPHEPAAASRDAARIVRSGRLPLVVVLVDRSPRPRSSSRSPMQPRARHDPLTLTPWARALSLGRRPRGTCHGQVSDPSRDSGVEEEAG
jgi:hypothetical protein